MRESLLVEGETLRIKSINDKDFEFKPARMRLIDKVVFFCFFGLGLVTFAYKVWDANVIETIKWLSVPIIIVCLLMYFQKIPHDDRARKENYFNYLSQIERSDLKDAISSQIDEKSRQAILEFIELHNIELG